MAARKGKKQTRRCDQPGCRAPIDEEPHSDGSYWCREHHKQGYPPERYPQPERSQDTQSESELQACRVKLRITEAGYYYRVDDGQEFGPFSREDEQQPGSDSQLAAKLGVEQKEIIIARLQETIRPTTFSEVGEVLGSTIRRDEPTKVILFCAGLLTFTNEDQVNVLMSAESSAGKSYDALEVVCYFPQERVIIIATASPTAFFHDVGKWDEEAKVLRVDLRQKILVFLDQPHFTLMERLRPLLSHDRRELLYKITDKSKGGRLRTKNVILEGFPTVIFCAAKLSLDEQERTRVFILSPETGPEKLEETLRLAIARVGDREEFKRWVESHPRRRWLKARIAAIRDAKINQVVIENQEEIYGRFLSQRQRLAPRHQRELPRILSLIKAHALLNFAHRERRSEATIIANQDDVEAGFTLYNKIAESNELGLSPQVYDIYESVIRPLVDANEGVDRKTISADYYARYGRTLPEERLRRDILPALEASGLIAQEPDPADRRRMRVVSPIRSPISGTTASYRNRGNDRGHPPLAERREQALAWLTDGNHHDNDGWGPLNSLSNTVGSDCVRILLEEGALETHPSDANLVRRIR